MQFVLSATFVGKKVSDSYLVKLLELGVSYHTDHKGSCHDNFWLICLLYVDGELFCFSFGRGFSCSFKKVVWFIPQVRFKLFSKWVYRRIFLSVIPLKVIGGRVAKKLSQLLSLFWRNKLLTFRCNYWGFFSYAKFCSAEYYVRLQFLHAFSLYLCILKCYSAWSREFQTVILWLYRLSLVRFVSRNLCYWSFPNKKWIV